MNGELILIRDIIYGIYLRLFPLPVAFCMSALCLAFANDSSRFCIASDGQSLSPSLINGYFEGIIFNLDLRVSG